MKHRIVYGALIGLAGLSLIGAIKDISAYSEELPGFLYIPLTFGSGFAGLALVVLSVCVMVPAIIGDDDDH